MPIPRRPACEARLESRTPPSPRPSLPRAARPRPAALAAAACLLPGLAVAAPAGFALDPVHTRVLFAVSHAGFSQALGTVSGSTGSLQFDPEDWSSARLSVSVPLARLDLGDAKWNAAVSARGLLDVARHPVATFVSARVLPKDPQHAAVCGTLSLRGVARDVCLEVTFHQLRRHPLPPFRRTAGFSATTTLSRKAFGIDAWPTVIGDAVDIRIEAEAVRSRAADEAAQPPAPPPNASSAAPPASTSVPAPASGVAAPPGAPPPAPGSAPPPPTVPVPPP